MCFPELNSEVWAAFLGALVGFGGSLAVMFLQARLTDQKDRESRLTAFRAFLATWRQMLDRETQRGLLQNEKNVQNYEAHLPELARHAAIVKRDLARGDRQRFRELVAKAGNYRPSDIEKQTGEQKLKILSDIDEMLSLIER